MSRREFTILIPAEVFLSYLMFQDSTLFNISLPCQPTENTLGVLIVGRISVRGVLKEIYG